MFVLLREGLKEIFVQKSLSFIENRIKWRASQYSLPNKRVFLFEGLDKKTKAKYLSQINLQDTGEIVLLFTDRKRNWTVLGTKMIVGYDGVQLNSVAFNDIKDWDGKKHHERRLISPEKLKRYRKRRECELLIFDKNDNETVFITRRGNDFWALANIVLMLIRLHK